MVVDSDSFERIKRKILDESEVSLDTETTGLRWYKGDKLFSLIIGTKSDTYYFNFNTQKDHLGVEPKFVLPREKIKDLLTPIALNTLKVVYMANAKFDMHFLAKEGIIKWECVVHDVLVMARLLFNEHGDNQYNLSAVAKRAGYEKLEIVEEYIKEHKLWSWVSIPGKKSRTKNLYFDQVPFEIMHKYAEQDARITFDIGAKQRETLLSIKWFVPDSRKHGVHATPYETELAVTKVLWGMERRGILVDESFCQEKLSEETTQVEAAAREFKDKTGLVLVDSAKTLGPVFAQLGYTLPKTEKGQDSISDKFLSSCQDPIAKVVQNYREHHKLAGTYYQSFLWFMTNEKKIHANARQAGTRTGRLSYSDPNCQNIPDSDVRCAFIPEKGFCLVSIDFDQQEYRLMLDYAAEMGLIEQVNSGLDIHTATANMMGVERKFAKTLNFMLLYGGGIVKLASALFPVTADEETLWAIWRVHKKWKNIPENTPKIDENTPLFDANLKYLLEAEKLKATYFERLPNVQALVSNVIARSKSASKLETWNGRQLHCPDPNFAYKMPNALIQGGCSDVAKRAMVLLDKFLHERKSKLLLSIHDEFLFQVHETELEIIPELRRIMEQAFPSRFLKLTCSVSHAWDNWGNLVEGEPAGKKTGDDIQRKGAGGYEAATENVVS